MNETDKTILDKAKQILEYLYDIDMFYYILKDDKFYDLFSNLFPELDDKYLIPTNPEYEPFLEDSEDVKAMKPIEWFGKNIGFVVKDDEYFLLSHVTEHGVKCCYIDKINTNNLEIARKIASIFEFLGDINSFRYNKKTAFWIVVDDGRFIIRKYIDHIKNKYRIGNKIKDGK